MKNTAENVINENIHLLTLIDDFNNEIDEIRKKYKPDFDKIEDDLDRAIYFSDLCNYIHASCFKNINNISALYKEPLAYYILFNKIEEREIMKNYLTSQGCHSINSIIRPSGSKVINVFPETTEKEVIKTFRKIKKELKEEKNITTKNYKLSDNIKRDIEIVKSHRQGISHKKIMKAINKKFSVTLGYEQIPMIVQRISTKLKDRFNLSYK